MQILGKREKDMTRDEKLRLDFIRTWLIVENGVNLRDVAADFDLTSNCRKAKVLDMLLTRFKIDYADPDDAKNYFPESEALWPGQPRYDEAMQMRAPNEDARRHDQAVKRSRIAALRDLDNLMSGKRAPKKLEPEKIPLSEQDSTKPPLTADTNGPRPKKGKGGKRK